MKRILIIFLSYIFLLSSVNAGTFIQDQATAISLVSNTDKTNTIIETIFATDNNNFSINNITYTYDIRLDYSLSDIMYFNYENTNTSDIITVLTQWGTGSNPTITKYDIAMTQIGTYTFAFNPDFEEELVAIYIDYPDNAGAFLENFQITRQRGISSVTNTFIGYTTQLVELNLSLWKLGYFVIIIILFIGFLMSIIFLIIKGLEWAEKLNEKKRKYIYGKRK